MDQPSNASYGRAPLSSNKPKASDMILLSMLRTAIWAICYFVFYFVQQLAELLAPLLLIAGVLWKVLPAVIGSLTHAAAAADPQARDAISGVAAAIPSHLAVAGYDLTASSLIWDGILLMALAAAGATLATIAGKNV
ncbi:hypothetical protein [Acetobacter orientalis]|uniref:hypothetical protein n=1 Tax=Acetobacter orientalis TaxID=146474 RepID=UPI0039EA0FEE